MSHPQKKFIDNRGELFFPLKNYNIIIKDSLISINNINVFRGIHIEQFTKIVTCIQGKILDIIINFNKEEEDYLIPKYYLLDPNTENYHILVEPNHGHAFITLSENSIVVYHYDDIYNPEKTKSINFKDPTFNIIPTLETYIKYPIENIIISDKDTNAPFYKHIDYYVFGGNGFIGSVIIDCLNKDNKTFYKTNLRLENLEKIEYELKLYKPKYVICSAGLTGEPNISWCDIHKTETIETNITFQMTLAYLCKKYNIHFTIIGSGVIFNNDRFYDENEEGNFYGNFYGKCRIYLENMSKNYNNLLYIRVNYPISSKKSNKNLITKLLSYPSIQNNIITLTYIDELIPYMIDMIEHNEIGICNFVNKGDISLFDIVDIYNKKTGHKFIKDTSTLLNNVNKSNSLLNIGKLIKYDIKNVYDAVEHCIIKYTENL